MVPQQPGRETDDTDDATMDPTPTFLPSEAWIDAFTLQCTDAFRLRAKRFAMRRLHGLSRAGAHVDDYSARELVQDILGDTLMGIRMWDPAAKTLQQHVEDVISSRVKHQRDRAKRFRHQRVDLFASDGDRQPARGEIEASMQMDHAHVPAQEQVIAREIVERFRELAADDHDVTTILEVIEDGADTRAEILHASGLTEKAFRNARGRLQRLADRVDPESHLSGHA